MAARYGSGAAGEPTSATRKRALSEVVPPEFVERQDEGGGYGVIEMPKRFMHGYVVENKGRVPSNDRMRAIEVDDARLTAQTLRVLAFAKSVLRMIHAEKAARAAALAVPGDS